MLRRFGGRRYGYVGSRAWAAAAAKPAGPTIIGIDLGTTKSCVAVVESGAARVLENKDGNMTTPSVVAFTNGGGRLVGDAAKRVAATNPRDTIVHSKRLMGRRYEEIRNKLKFFPFNIVRGPKGEAWIQTRGRAYAPAQIGALILEKMKETAEDYLTQKVTRAVVTVPAYFNDAQRMETAQAARLAGLEVDRIINEPTAAALAYGLGRAKERQTFAVYDIGGGTFDISVLRVEDEVFEVLATNGDTYLGGQDVDSAIVQHLASEFRKQHADIDLQADPAAWQRLTEEAERAKKALDHVTELTVSVPFIAKETSGAAIHLQIKFTRDELNKLSEPILERTKRPCELCLRDAKLQPGELEKVILVGGLSRMPYVKDVVQQTFNKEPFQDLHPEHAVACGAAIQGGILTGQIASGVTLIDVTPLSLGIETLGGAMSVIIPRNTALPAAISEEFTTSVDGQRSVDINIFQGERELAVDNKLLGNFKLVEIPPMPRGRPRLQVAFRIDTNGILNVTARDLDTNREQQVTVHTTGGITPAEVQRLLKEAVDNREVDREKRETAERRAEAESIIYATLAAAEVRGAAISPEERIVFDRSVAEVRQAMEHGTAMDIRAALTDMQTTVVPILDDAFRKMRASEQRKP